MASISARQESFIKLMTESEELARRGFDLLLKRQDFDQFFDHLQAAGLFEPTRNPAPVPVDEKGFFRIPFWSALDYLVAVARRAGAKPDLELGQKVMAIVRSATVWVDSTGSKRDNYHTYRRFAEILGVVPLGVVSDEDIELVAVWLGSRFDKTTVGHMLGEAVIPAFLAGQSSVDWKKALDILAHCTAITWVDAKEFGDAEKKPTMPVGDYWLNKLVARHAHTLGERLGQLVADLFLTRTIEVFGGTSAKTYSRIYRPAIEEHSQNHSWRGPENICVQGLRDALLGWCQQDSASAVPYVSNLIGRPEEILRRIAISVIDQRWEFLSSVFLGSLSPQIFDSGHLHELHRLLSGHFTSFSETDRARTVDSIRGLAEPTWADDPARALAQTQRQWLSAIADKGYPPADEWYAELNANDSIGGLGDHPDFDSYMETWSGPGPSPYTAQELLAFASDGSLIERVNAFKQTGAWKEPTARALVDAIEEAVRQAPGVFVRRLPNFLSARRPFQYAVINGLKSAWDSTDKASVIDWALAWEQIVSFLEELTASEGFWNEAVVDGGGLNPTRDWIPPTIAELLRAGTKDDAHSYPETLLPRTWALIGVLLERAPAAAEPSDDAMAQAINSSKGKAVEALMSHALRSCRVADRSQGNHAEAWEIMRQTFDSELAKSKGENFEFSTLSGAYLANLLYLSREWVHANLSLIFPEEHPSNNLCALDGLAYCGAHSSVYSLLLGGNVIDRAIRSDLKGRYTLEKLVQRIAVAYVRGEEGLDSPRFDHFFEAAKKRELELVARFFWSIRAERLSSEQVKRVVAFWDRCVQWAAGLPEPPTQLLSALASLAVFIEAATGRDLELLSAVAPFVHLDHGDYQFFEELTRLAPTHPAEIAMVLGRSLEAHIPDFDYEDRLKTLLKLLHEHGQKDDAIKFAEMAHDMSGMQGLFDYFTQGK